MADWLKIALKAATLTAGAALIVVLFTQVQIPALDLSQLTPWLGVGLAIARHWVPGFNILWPLALAWLAFDLTVWGVKWALVAIKWVLRVAE